MKMLNFKLGFEPDTFDKERCELFCDNVHSLVFNLYRSTRFQHCTFLGVVHLGLCKLNM